MELDRLFSIVLTASAAIVVAMVSRVLGGRERFRWLLAGSLGAWFVVVVLLAATDALGAARAGVGGLGIAVLLPMVILGITVMRSTTAHRALLAAPLAWLVGVHVVRVLGVGFLLLHDDGRLSAPFATVAGWGDILVGLAAVPIAWLVQAKGRAVLVPLLLWNTVGLVDLIVAVGLGVVSAPGPLQLISAPPGSAVMTTLPWLLVPGFLVPLLTATHLALFYRLYRNPASCGDVSGVDASGRTPAGV